MSTSAFFPKVLAQAVNAASRAELQATAAEAARLLGTDAPPRPASSDDGGSGSALLTAVVALLAEAQRQAAVTDTASFVDWCVGSTAVRVDKAELLGTVFAQLLEGEAGNASPGDGFTFFPRATGLSYTAAHELGDRTQLPPQRSLPAFEYSLSLERDCCGATTAEGSSSSIRFAATAEQAEFLLAKLQDMVREAQRLSE